MNSQQKSKAQRLQQPRARDQPASIVSKLTSLSPRKRYYCRGRGGQHLPTVDNFAYNPYAAGRRATLMASRSVSDTRGSIQVFHLRAHTCHLSTASKTSAYKLAGA